MNFNDFLLGVFMTENPEYSTDDPEDNSTVMNEFEEWLSDLDITTICEYADEYAEKRIAKELKK
jgi:hypothetical protein